MTPLETILFEVWTLSYHMNIQPNDAMLMTPNERKYLIEQFIR